MKKPIAVFISLSCISVLGFVLLNDTDEPADIARQQHEHAPAQEHVIRNELQRPAKIETHQKKRASAGEKTKPVKWASSPPTLEELRKKIASAKDNKELIQTVLDIEHSAAYDDIAPLIEELYDVWVTSDPLAALDYSQVLSERFDDGMFRQYALEKAAAHSVTDAQKWLNQNNVGPKEEQDRNILAFYSGVAANDPAEALQHVGDIQNPEYRYELKQRSLEEWAKHDPQEALAWLETDSGFINKDEINDAYINIVYPMLDTSPTEAESIILGMESSQQKNALVGLYAHRLAESDSEAAMAWAQNISDAKTYNVAVASTLEVLANSEETRSNAMELASREANPDLREEFLTRTIGYIAAQDTNAAVEKLSSLTFEEQQNIAISVAYSFSEDESRRAWMNALPNSELREAILNSAPEKLN